VCVRSPTGFEVAWVFRLLFTHAIHVSQEKTCVFLFVVLFLHIYAYIPLISLNCIKKGAGRRLAGWKLGGRMELSLYIYIYRAGGGTGGLKAVAAAALVFLLLHLNIINDLSLYSLSYLQLSGTSKEGERWQPYEKHPFNLGILGSQRVHVVGQRDRQYWLLLFSSFLVSSFSPSLLHPYR